MCLFVCFLLLLLLGLRFSAKGVLMQELSCIFVKFRRHVHRGVRVVMNLWWGKSLQARLSTSTLILFLNGRRVAKIVIIWLFLAVVGVARLSEIQIDEGDQATTEMQTRRLVRLAWSSAALVAPFGLACKLVLDLKEKVFSDDSETVAHFLQVALAHRRKCRCWGLGKV